MPRKSQLETHPEIEEIRKELIEGRLSQEAVADKHKVTRSAVRWYYERKMKPEIEALREDREVKAKADTIDTLEVLDNIIGKWTEAVDSANLNQILKALELRARITGEEQAPPRIEIVWGKGLDTKLAPEKSVGDSDIGDPTKPAPAEDSG